MTPTPYLLLLATSAILLAVSPKRFGSVPRGERLQRVQQSPNYRDGAFRNLDTLPQRVDTARADDGAKKQRKKGWLANYYDIFVKKHEGLKPDSAIPVVKTDLRSLDPGLDVLVWLGHQSCYLQLGGRRMLIDPVLSKAASPVFFANRAFKGTSIYAARDVPELDYLIISHDHWDHLDYPTVRALKPKVARVICPLGVGQHFERWGFDAARVVEMDWHEALPPDAAGLTITCLPARHFSGRGVKRRNQALWASFLIATPQRRVFFSGDGGYGSHFADIGRRHAPIDLAILDGGQYDERWRYTHMMPEDVVLAAVDLGARAVLPAHHSRFAMARHPWAEPLDRVVAAHAGSGFRLLTPMIGEPVPLHDSTATFKRWWR